MIQRVPPSYLWTPSRRNECGTGVVVGGQPTTVDEIHTLARSTLQEAGGVYQSVSVAAREADEAAGCLTTEVWVDLATAAASDDLARQC